MNSVFSEQILADKLSKLNSTQQCIETLSHWCIFHRSKAELVVTTWDKQFNSSDMAKKVPLLYLANDILQNSKRKGNEFVTEFWKVLPSALKAVVSDGDERGKTVVSRLVGIWEERRVFGSQAKSLKDAMLGEELPPPLELRKKRSRSVRIMKKDSRSIKTKLSIGGTAEKIVSAFHLVISEHANEDEEMSKCKSAVHRVKKMENDVDVALTKAKDPSRKTLAKELKEEESTLKQCIGKLKEVENNRVALVDQLRDALQEQESELENVRTQIQVAQAQVEEATNMRKQLDDEDRVFDSKPSTTTPDANTKSEGGSKKSAAAIAAEVADRLAASTSSQYIMTSVLSSFAAEEAKSAGLASTSTSTPSSLSNSMSKSENLSVSDPKAFMAAAAAAQMTNNHPYQGGVPIPDSQALYHSIPNQPPMQQQYMQQQPSYDYMQQQQQQQQPAYMVPMMPQTPQITQQQQQMQPMTMPQQQLQPPASFRPLAPLQPPGMVYFSHHYRMQ